MNIIESIATSVFVAQAAQHAGSGFQQNNEAAQIRRIGEEVRLKMSSYERAHWKEPSVCALYLHFFLSILALAECCVYLALLFASLCVLFVTYYIIICVSCGKWRVSTDNILAKVMKIYGIYSGLFCVIIGNIVAPWSPLMLAFSDCVLNLNRPAVEGSQGLADNMVKDLERGLKGEPLCACCCCCCDAVVRFTYGAIQYNVKLQIPHYKMMQGFFFSYGGLSSCGQRSVWFDADKMVQLLQDEVFKENAPATEAFYRQEYGCSSFDEVLARQLGVTPTVGIPNAPPIAHAYRVN